MSNTKEKPKGMLLADVLKKLGCSRAHFYTHYADRLTKHKDGSNYRNIYLLEEVEALVDEIQKFDIVK